MKQILRLSLVISLLPAGLQAQNIPAVGATPRVQSGQPVQVQEVEEYVIGPEDVLSINVWKEPELTSRVTVRPDGKIGMPLLNEIDASGLTPRQLQEKITEGLKKYIAGPSVSVIVNDIKSHVVYVTGSVGKPGVFVLGAPTTVMELLIRAGGLTEFAKSEEIQILRPEGNTTRRFRFNFKQFAEGRDYQQNIRLKRGDIVIVP